jgi:hypothetical protein
MWKLINIISYFVDWSPLFFHLYYGIYGFWLGVFSWGGHVKCADIVCIGFYFIKLDHLLS